MVMEPVHVSQVIKYNPHLEAPSKVCYSEATCVG